MASRAILSLRLHFVTNCKPLFLLEKQTITTISQKRFQSAQSQQTSLVPEDHQQHGLSLGPFELMDDAKREFLDGLHIPAKRSFNLAAYINQSHTLQKLLKLEVSLFDIDQKNRKAAQYLLGLDFERDCVKYIKFLVDNGLKESNLGRFISEYPHIFREDLNDLQERINYLEKKRFTKKQIATALNRSSFILSHSMKTVDHRLGFLQVMFNLPGQLVREIFIKYPPVIALSEDQFKVFDVTITSEFGFNLRELHQILEIQPCIFAMSRDVLIDRIDFVHNTMKLSHSTIAAYPKLITGPYIEICQRYHYLEKLKRNQFNPRKPLYVPPSALYKINDEEFCEKYAKTDLDDYKLFIKSR